MAIFCHFHRVALKRKIPETVYVSGICFVLLLFLSGATRNRTPQATTYITISYKLLNFKATEFAMIDFQHFSSNFLAYSM